MTSPSGFFDALREGAELTGHADLADFLEEVAVIRWSSTIATNVLAEEKGPRLGLLLSPGHEDDLYGEGENPAVGHLNTRKVLGEEAGVYDWDDLSTGATITGPAMLESETNTCYITDGWKLQMDGFANGILSKQE